MTRALEPHKPTTYLIRVKGTLDPSWSEWFDGMVVEATVDGNTLLTGPIRDQTALHGLLGKIRDMGLPLLSVEQLNRRTKMKTDKVDRIVRLISAISMIVAPVATMVAFAIHPQFWTFKKESSAAIQFEYIQTWGWQVGHMLVYLTIPLVIIMWLMVARKLSVRHPGLAVAGGFLSLFGWVFMAGTFATTLAEGVVGLTFPKEQAVPVIQLIMDSPGLMQVTLWGQLGALLGPMVLSLGMALTPEVAPRWAGVLALVGNVIIAVFIDIDGIMIWGELLILIGLFPVAKKLLRGEYVKLAIEKGDKPIGIGAS